LVTYTHLVFFLYIFHHTEHTIVSTCVIIVGIIALVLYEKSHRSNPGFIPNNKDIITSLNQKTSLSKSSTSSSDSESSSNEQKKEGNEMCSTCKITKPLRSKHCRMCDKCVYRFDHHCPWVHNCIGAENHAYYYLFLAFQLVSISLNALLCYGEIMTWNPNVHYNVNSYRYIALWSALIITTIIFIPVACLLFSHTFKIARNITTNEMINHRRFSYISLYPEPYKNLFDLGTEENCREFFNCFANERKNWFPQDLSSVEVK